MWTYRTTAELKAWGCEFDNLLKIPGIIPIDTNFRILVSSETPDDSWYLIEWANSYGKGCDWVWVVRPEVLSDVAAKLS